MRLSLSGDDLQSQNSARAGTEQYQIIQELVEVLDLHQDKPSSQETAQKPEQKPAEQKPEQANKWLAFQKLVSQQAAEEAALQKVGVPSICHCFICWVKCQLPSQEWALISCRSVPM